MTWDTSDTTATIGGTDSGKVSTTVSYEDSGATLVIDVTTNFSAGDDITVSAASALPLLPPPKRPTTWSSKSVTTAEPTIEDSNTIAIGGAPTIDLRSHPKLYRG